MMTAQIIPMPGTPKAEERICAFCYLPESKVKSLLVGVTGKCICGECIKKAAVLLSA